MSIFKIVSNDAGNIVGTLTGNMSSHHAQEATNASIQGMDLFSKVFEQKKNTPFAQSKGNLFEYIEAAKFNVDASRKGSLLNAVVTDSVGRPHDPVDIEIINNGKVVRQVQAKFSDSKFAAADSITMHRNEKYTGMQRLIRKDDSYLDAATGQRVSLLEKAKSLASKRASQNNGVYQKQYQDVLENITDELNHDGITSGGTTLEELQKAHASPELYVRAFEHKQFVCEMKTTSRNMAAASMVTSGIISGTTNFFAVFKNEKALSQALNDVGKDVINSGIRGGATGIISSAIRYKSAKADIRLLADPMAATIMANGIIDGGVALYSYAKGDISAEQLRDNLIDTTIKSTATIYYSKAIPAIMGASVNPFIPMVIYTAASYVTASTREIIKNAHLNAEEHNRMAALYQESTKAIKEYHIKFKKHIANCEKEQRKILEGFINTFEYNIQSGKNYDQALYSIVSFANQASIALQHVSFDDFKNSMNSNDPFILE